MDLAEFRIILQHWVNAKGHVSITTRVLPLTGNQTTFGEPAGL